MKLFSAVALLIPSISAAAQQTSVSYREQIAPIFAANCNACHGGKQPQSGLVTAAYTGLLKGGRHGRAVVPGSAGGSLLVKYIEGTKTPRMPIGGALRPAEIALIERWIAEGAKSDGEPSAGPALPKVKAAPGVLPQVASLAWSKDGKLLAVGTYHEVKLYAMPGGKLVRTLGGHADVVRALAFSPDGGTLAAAGGAAGVGGEIRLWNVATGALVRTLEGHSDAIYAVGWRPDGKQLASGSYDKTVRLWDVAEEAMQNAKCKVQNAKSGAAPKQSKIENRKSKILADHADAVFALAYSPNGKYLATGSADRSIRLWDAATGKRLYALTGHTDAVTALAFHPTADQLLSASADKTVRLWNLRADGGDQARVFPGQSDVLTDVRWSPDGRQFATASNDGAVKVWDAAKGAPMRDLPHGADAVLAVCFAPDGKSVAVGGYDGALTVYNVADGAAVAALIAPPKRAVQSQQSK